MVDSPRVDSATVGFLTADTNGVYLSSASGNEGRQEAEINWCVSCGDRYALRASLQLTTGDWFAGSIR
jgi:hypothetical protein